MRVLKALIPHVNRSSEQWASPLRPHFLVGIAEERPPHSVIEERPWQYAAKKWIDSVADEQPTIDLVW